MYSIVRDDKVFSSFINIERRSNGNLPYRCRIFKIRQPKNEISYYVSTYIFMSGRRRKNMVLGEVADCNGMTFSLNDISVLYNNSLSFYPCQFICTKLFERLYIHFNNDIDNSCVTIENDIVVVKPTHDTSNSAICKLRHMVYKTYLLKG